MRREMLPWHHHPGHPHVVVPVRVDPTGRHGPTPSSVRRGRWRRVAPGWAVPADVDGAVIDQRIVEAAVRLTAYGAVTGWAALHWQGARWFDREDPIPLATGNAGIRGAAGVRISEEQLVPAEIVVVDGLRITTPVRSTLFEMRHAPQVLGAVQALDMACYSDLVSLAEAAAYGDTLGTWTGVPQSRLATGLGDENAWSITEVAMREMWERDAGRGRPLTNVPLFDVRGRHLVTPDLLDPVAGVVGEYDGAVHLDAGTKQRDVRRDELYRRLGLEAVVMSAPDLRDRGPVLARLQAAYERAERSGSAPRGWSLAPPPWWRSTRTVVERRALAAEGRSRFLRYRDAA